MSVSRWTAFEIGATLALVLGISLPGYAASAQQSFTVDTFVDEVDSAPGDGLCATQDGKCSLRAAVQESNAMPGVDTIVLSSGTYPLSIVGRDEDAAATGDLDITDDVSIIGTSATIDAAALDDRIVENHGRSLLLYGVDLTNGGAPDLIGGGIYARGPANTVITDSDIIGNEAQGGAAFVLTGTSRVTSSTISDNSGGAVTALTIGTAQFNNVELVDNTTSGPFAGLLAAGPTTISFSTVARNIAGGLSGGIFITSGQTLTANDTMVEGNRSTLGAGLAGDSGSSIEVVDSTIQANEAVDGGAGGGIYGMGMVSLSGSSVLDNRAGDVGGVLAAEGLTMADSTVARNEAVGGSGSFGGHGGGVVAVGPTQLANSTVSGNVAADSVGGLFVAAGSASLDSVTITDNAAAVGAGIYVAGPGVVGAGTPAGSVTSVNTIVAAQQGGALDCVIDGTLFSAGFNLSSDGSCGFASGGDQSAVDPDLLPLSSNGGSTLTHLPNVGSSVVDAGQTGAPFDQRGVSRPAGLADIGAVEADGLRLLVNSGADAVDDLPGDGVCQGVGQPAGDCTLRAAIDEVNSGLGTPEATVRLADGIGIVLSIAGTGEDLNQTGDLDLANPALIVGKGSTISAAGLDRVIDATAAVRMREVSVEDGYAFPDSGGGIQANAGLELVEVVVQNNWASTDGGGIRSTGALTVSGSQISDNYAGRDGGAISAKGATVVDSLLEANSVGNSGNGSAIASTTVTIVSSTIAGNEGPWGGAIYGSEVVLRHSTVVANKGKFVVDTGSLELWYSTVDRNQVSKWAFDLQGGRGTAAASMIGTMDGPSCIEQLTSLGFNYDLDGSCVLDQPSDQAAGNALLLALADNGGPAPTAMPAGTSPLLDQIPIGVLGCGTSEGADQRGSPRPLTSACDVGAVEGAVGAVSPLTLLVTTPVDAGDSAPGDGVCQAIGGAPGDCSLRAAVDESNQRVSTDIIQIAPGVNPVTSLSGAGEDQNLSGDIDVLDHVELRGSGAVIDGGGLDRVLQQRYGTLKVDDLTFTNGSTPWSEDGGGLLVTGPTEIARSAISGNVANVSGGGIYGRTALIVTESAIEQNTARYGGGISSFSSLVIVDSSVTANQGRSLGGGIAAFGFLDLSRTEVARNEGDVGSGVNIGRGEALIDQAAIVANTGRYGWEATVGSGVNVQESQARITNTTISNNLGGRAVVGRRSTVDIAFSTITDDPFGAGLYSGGHGGALGGYQTTVTVEASILRSWQTDAECEPGVGVLSLGYNVISDSSCGAPGPGDRLGVDPVLGVMADDGSGSWVQPPFAGSPAIDMIPLGAAGCGIAVVADQRENPRPEPGNAGCSAGALDMTGPPLVPLDMVVDTPDDLADSDPGDGVCDVGDGRCSLRAAVVQSDVWPSVDRITILPGVDPTLILADPPPSGGLGLMANIGDLDINDEVMVMGNGATIFGLDANATFYVRGGPVTLVDISVEVGDREGLYVGPAGSVAVTRGTFSNGTLGGAIVNDGQLDLIDTDLIGNTTLWRGGALLNRGSLAVTGGTISANAAREGGGLQNEGTAVLTGVSVVQNAIGNSYGTGDSFGAGIRNDGVLTLDGGLVGDNIAVGSVAEGGGLYNSSAATATIVDASFVDNVADGGLAARGGAIRNAGDLTISTTSLAGNSVVLGIGSAAGGAIYSTGSASLLLTTLSGNSAATGSAIYAAGAASSTRIDRATVAGNSSSGGAAIQRFFAAITVANTVIGTQDVGTSCLTTITSGGYNADDDGSCLDGSDATDLLVGNSELGLLADNGGPTMTQLPAITSRLIDVIPFGLVDRCDGTIVVDQRGLPRPEPVSGYCDIGAVERQPTDP